MDPAAPRHGHDDSGFSLIEVMISAVILVTGLLSIAYALGLALGTIDTAQMDSIARQKARQAMEDVFTARDTGTLGFSALCNLPTSGCAFLSASTQEPMYSAGPDGLVFTSDDGTAAPISGIVTSSTTTGNALPNGCSTAPCIETVDTPGPDGILGTSDDLWVPLNGYTRNITITSAGSNLDKIVVTISYHTPEGVSRSVVLVALIGPYV
jgi:prepilin-type N-terminal cleavage/methylation domain-containing protein